MTELKNLLEGGKKKSSRGRSKSRTSSKSRSSSKSKKVSSKKRSSSRRRKIRGGGESSGATPLPPSYYDPRSPVASYSANNGFGATTAYGPASPLDIGSGLLAPYNTNLNGNQTSMEKVGGKKKKTISKKSKSKKMKGGALINKMNDSAVVGIQKIVGKTVDGINDYLKSLDRNFDKSVKAAEGIKIGEQRLIQQYGGKKKKTTKSTKKVKKTTTKKTTKKRRSMKGGDGSDFALTLNSRGPVNYPVNGWYNGEQLFRQFTKTGDYIPNDQLPYAAAPISTLSDIPKGGIITGFDNLGQQWASVGK